MNFQQAIEEIGNGNKVRRKQWDKDDFISLDDGNFFVFPESDKTADDWEIVEEDEV